MKIVSGGQTGVDRAALDAAMAAGLEVGGWCPRGRVAEDGGIAEIYPLRETPSGQYAQRTEWNVRDSDATLVLTQGKAAGGTASTMEVAARYGRPRLAVDLDETRGVERAREWMAPFAVVNIAGPREETCKQVYARALSFLSNVFRGAASR